MVERGGELQPAAAHVGQLGEEFEGGAGVHRLTRLGGLLAVDEHLSGHDERLRLLAGFGQAALDQEAVQPRLHDLRSTMRSASSSRRAARAPKTARDSMGAGALGRGHAARFREAVDSREGDLVLLGVLARGLAQGFGGLLHVQNVIDDLESQAHVLSVAGKRVVLLGSGAGVDGAEAQAGAQQGAGLRAVDGLEQLRVGRFVFALEVEHLPSDHAVDCAGGGGEFGRHARAADGAGVFERGQHFEGEREQGVPGEDRHGLAEYLVAGGLAAAVVVVIEGGEVVVD